MISAIWQHPRDKRKYRRERQAKADSLRDSRQWKNQARCYAGCEGGRTDSVTETGDVESGGSPKANDDRTGANGGQDLHDWSDSNDKPEFFRSGPIQRQRYRQRRNEPVESGLNR
jgi:hypothetical protein